MKVLITGASGFVGSHILDSLRARGVDTVVLLRPTSDRTFIQPHLASVEVRLGSVSEPESLKQALKNVSHIIHCAGCTRARTTAEFYNINQTGTRNLVDAVNRQGGLERLVHISSLAAIGPAVPARPARENDTPHPVSDYGKSKLAGELEVRNHCQAPFTVLRPPAVYGPRDYGFLSMFQAVKRHLLPRPNASQSLSLVFVKDLGEAAAISLQHPAAAGKSYFVAAREIVTGRTVADEIARRVGHWSVPCPLPSGALWAACLFQEGLSRLTRKPSLLNMQKFAELCAPGWVCDASLLEKETGFRCLVELRQGVEETLKWYQQNGWL